MLGNILLYPSRNRINYIINNLFIIGFERNISMQ